DTRTDIDRFQADQRAAEQALEILDVYCPAKKSMLSALEGRRRISPEEYGNSAERVADTGAAAYSIIKLARELEDCRAEQLRLHSKLEELAPWLELDISMELRGTRETAVFIGTFPQLMTREDILTRLAEMAPE